MNLADSSIFVVVACLLALLALHGVKPMVKIAKKLLFNPKKPKETFDSVLTDADAQWKVNAPELFASAYSILEDPPWVKFTCKTAMIEISRESVVDFVSGNDVYVRITDEPDDTTDIMQEYKDQYDTLKHLSSRPHADDIINLVTEHTNGFETARVQTEE